MQEVVLARSIRVLCGSRWLSWDNLARLGEYAVKARWFENFCAVIPMGHWGASVSGSKVNPAGILGRRSHYVLN
jgi:hypothetical protein